MATAVGGPTTLPGTLFTVPSTFTGDWPRSRMVIESGVGLSALLVTPFSCLTLWSLDETAICAQAGAEASPSVTQTLLMIVYRMASLLRERARLLQVSLAYRFRRPIGQRSDQAGWVVAQSLRKRRGAGHEHVVHVPTLQVAVDGAGVGIDAHDRAAVEVGGLVAHAVEVLAEVLDRDAQ